MISEKRGTNEVNPMIGPAHCLVSVSRLQCNLP